MAVHHQGHPHGRPHPERRQDRPRDGLRRPPQHLLLHPPLAERQSPERQLPDQTPACAPAARSMRQPLHPPEARPPRPLLHREPELRHQPHLPPLRLPHQLRSTRRRSCRLRKPGVALRARVRAARTQTHHRVDHKRQRLVLDDDLLDGLSRRQLVNRGNRQNRLAFVGRFLGENLLALVAGLHAFAERAATLRFRQVVGRQNRLHARHRERRAQIEAGDARVRHRTQHQLRPQHAVDAVVFRVLGLARHLRGDIGRGVVLSDEFLGVLSHGYAPRRCSAPFIRAVRILS
ncbi:MAG: hypothetical protein U0Q11_27715 [Vicinamibacterales bacterium]